MNQCREETSIYRLVKAVTPLNALHKSLGNKEINALFQSLGTVVAIGVAIFLPRVPYAAASRPSGWIYCFHGTKQLVSAEGKEAFRERVNLRACLVSSAFQLNHEAQSYSG